MGAELPLVRRMAAIQPCSWMLTVDVSYRSSRIGRLQLGGTKRRMCRASSKGDAAPVAAEEDYYSVLGLRPDASTAEIKKAYYSCMKVCHPDLIGDRSGATDFCMFINEVYEVLSDSDRRMAYDELNGYALSARNPFDDLSATKDRIFVDEFTCIGCKNCSNTAPCTFAMEDEFGRARVASQSGDPTQVQVAVETCPVDCIHWVSSRQLKLLEDEMRNVERVNVGVMLSGMGYQSPDVFEMASGRWEKKYREARDRVKARLMRESGPLFWWQDAWVPKAGSTHSDDQWSRASAAARRWREYSGEGGRKTARDDAGSTRSLPERIGK